MKKEALDFMRAYLNAYSPTGFEVEGQKVWMDYLTPYVDEFITDTYGTAVGVVNPGKAYKVVIEAHADEISWFVSYISADGFIYVKKNGGSDHQIAPAKRVKIFGDKGIVNGVFGWPAIHTRKKGAKEVSPDPGNIFIDVGAKDGEEVNEMGIRVGCVIAFEDGFTTLNDDLWYCGRALDNRMGGFMIAQVARRLKEAEVEVPFTLYVVNSVQEEVGLRGAQMIAERLQPNVALVVDVTHDTQTPMVDKIKEGNIVGGNGPVLMVGPSVHNNLFRELREIAENHEIPFQFDSASRSTGTDTDAFAYSNSGVASALISLPLRYMHTTVEMCHRDDVENVIQLMFEWVKQLEDGKDYSYFA